MKLLVALRKELMSAGAQAMLVSNQHNVSYFTGIRGLATGEREAYLLITSKNNYLFAFATTYLMYKSVPGFKSIEITVGNPLKNAINRVISVEKIKTVLMEQNDISYADYLDFTGKLAAELKPAASIIENIRRIKNENEIGQITKAAGITDLAFEYIIGEIRSNVSEKDLAMKIEFFIREKTENISFSPIVAFNSNAAVPHYLPSPDSRLKKHSLILLDFGAKYQGYCADMSRVVFFGSPPPEYIRVYKTVLEAQSSAIKALKPGIPGVEVDSAARNIIRSSGFPVFNHGLGHGVGLAIHESPRLSPTSRDKLDNGTVFTVEPGIYLEGKSGVRIEDLVVMNSDGPELLSHASRDIIVI